LFLWSTAGVNYARTVAARYQLTELFDGYTAKPDIIIDDMPSTAVAPFIFNVQDETSWQSMAERIIEKHID
jgi:competence transcription factor ComK